MLQDQATFIEAAVNEVLSAAFIGGVIAVFVLLLFMRDLWSTLIISLSIPLSVVATFGGMYLSGISLNIMSLGGLALGIGMLVDNSIELLRDSTGWKVTQISDTRYRENCTAGADRN